MSNRSDRRALFGIGPTSLSKIEAGSFFVEQEFERVFLQRLLNDRLAASCARLGRVEAQRDPVESISAISLLTADMVESVTFYQTLGFHLLYGGPEAPFTSFRVGTGYLNLQLDTSASLHRALWGRVVLWVDDVDAMYRRALRAGLVPTAEPSDAPWGERYFHIHDPSGHELSFARPLPKR